MPFGYMEGLEGLGRRRVATAYVSASYMSALFFSTISQGIFVRTRSGFWARGRWSVVGGRGRCQCWVAVAYVSASYTLALFFSTISHCSWRDFISMSVGLGRCRVAAAYVSAGSMLVKSRVQCWSNFLSLLATVRGGISFLCRWGWVGAGLLLLTLARVQCWLNFLSLLATVRGGTSFPCRWGWVGAGLLLRTLARVQCWLYFLSLLATVRGGTSFLCPTATKKRSKENASPQSVLSVPSVQTTAFGSRVERCSQNHGHLKPSFSRIPTSPRFATSALGLVRRTYGPARHRAYQHLLWIAKLFSEHRFQIQISDAGVSTQRKVFLGIWCTRAAAGRGGSRRLELAREHWWRSVGMSGFARRRVSSVRRSSEHRATWEPKAVACTLGTLNIDCGKAFSLLRFFVAVGQRNEVPPRTVANSDKKYSQH